MAARNTCFRCGWNWDNWDPYKEKKGRSLYACQAPHCQAYNVIFCDQCLKEMNPKKGLFGGSNMPQKCPVCGVGQLSEVST